MVRREPNRRRQDAGRVFRIACEIDGRDVHHLEGKPKVRSLVKQSTRVANCLGAYASPHDLPWSQRTHKSTEPAACTMPLRPLCGARREFRSRCRITAGGPGGPGGGGGGGHPRASSL